MIIKFFFFSLTAACLLFISGCVKSETKAKPCELTSICIIDRNGISETLNTPERLKKYQNIDFSNSQPYQKVTRVYGRDQEGNAQSYVSSYYPNGQPKQYLEAYNNRAYGAYREWHSNGFIKLETFIVGGEADINTSSERSWLFDGCSKAWDEDGNLIAKIEYCKGELEGVSSYYHPNGKTWKLIPYRKNQVEGIVEIYLDNEELLQTMEYTKGEKNGPSIRYWCKNSISSEECYQNGLLISGKYYDPCGQCISEVIDGSGYRALFSKETLTELQEYHNGVLDGEIKSFGRNAFPSKIIHVKNGLKNGEEIEYYETFLPTQQKPIQKLSIQWFEGKIQGIVRTWYDSGILESQKEMSNNAKNGLLTAWYKDGSLMLIEEYDYDKLTKGEYFKKGEIDPISEITHGKGLATLFDDKGNILNKIPYMNGKPVF